jgi:ATP-binding cassette subfamily C protein
VRSQIRSSVSESFTLLEKSERKRLLKITFAQCALSSLDLLAVLLIGAVGSLAILGVQSRDIRVYRLLENIGVGNWTFQSQVAALSALAAFLLVAKTIISTIVIWRTTKYYSFLASRISVKIVDRYLNRTIEKLNERTTQQALYGLTSGVQNIVVGVVATLASVISDIFLVFVMVATLMFTDVLMALSSFIIFASFAVVLHVLVGSRTEIIAKELYPKRIEVNEGITHAIDGFRELYVSGKLLNKVKEIERSSLDGALLSSKQAFLPYISKYLVEIMLVLSLVVVSFMQFIQSDAVESAGNLGLFLAASSRIAPAALRIQQGVAGILNGYGGGESTLELNKSLPEFGLSSKFNFNKNIDLEIPSISASAPVVEFRNVTFGYSKNKQILKNINFEVYEGQKILIVGKSGSGKSSLLDLLVGLLLPNEGEIRIWGQKPVDFLSTNGREIALVPQSSFLPRSSLIEYFRSISKEVTEDQIWDVLEIVDLKSYVEKLPNQLETVIAENAKNFSGGQRQRITLARALVSSPKLLILDEATSALDPLTEAKILEQLKRRNFAETTISITHKFHKFADFDKIGIIDKQGLVFGSPSDVMKRSPLLRKMRGQPNFYKKKS